MARDFIDVCFIAINGKAVNTIKSLAVNSTDPGAEAVATMNPLRRALAHKHGVRQYELDIEATIQSPAEVDWEGLFRNKTLFLLTYQESAGASGGDIYHAKDCKISEISRSYADDGTVTASIKVMPLDHFKEE